MGMEIRFWGVRGSIASPGPATAGVGGNTSSVEVRCGEARLLLDAGTGIRGLGAALLAEGPVEATLLLSHLHWDHIQGLPFFAPLYMPSTRLTIVGPDAAELTLRETFEHQMRAPVFPVRWSEVPAYVAYRAVRPGQSIQLGDVTVRTAKLNHPGGVMAYRIEHGGRSVVYATDTEHYACVDPVLQKLAEGADLLIYDSQYTAEEYRGVTGGAKVGWGHSTWEAGSEVARAAGVGRYVLFHHDPTRSDAAVAELEAKARTRFPASVAAREGMVIELHGRPGARGGGLIEGFRGGGVPGVTGRPGPTYARPTPAAMQRLSLLLDLSSLLAREVDLDALLGAACERVAEALDADRATLWLVDAERGDLVTRVASLPELPLLRQPMDRGIAGFVARTGEVVRVDEASSDPRFDPTADRATGYVTRTMLVAPLREAAEGPVRGVMQVLNRAHGPLRRRGRALPRRARDAARPRPCR